MCASLIIIYISKSVHSYVNHLLYQYKFNFFLFVYFFSLSIQIFWSLKRFLFLILSRSFILVFVNWVCECVECGDYLMPHCWWSCCVRVVIVGVVDVVVVTISLSHSYSLAYSNTIQKQNKKRKETKKQRIIEVRIKRVCVFLFFMNYTRW